MCFIVVYIVLPYSFLFDCVNQSFNKRHLTYVNLLKQSNKVNSNIGKCGGTGMKLANTIKRHVLRTTYTARNSEHVAIFSAQSKNKRKV